MLFEKHNLKKIKKDEEHEFDQLNHKNMSL